MKFSPKNNISLSLIGFTVLVALGTLLGILLPNQESLLVQGLRIVFGSIFILFLPGYFLVKSFFSDSEIDVLERFALSFALSISVVPLLTFYTNLLGLKITALNVYMITIGVIVLCSLYILFFQKSSPGVPPPSQIHS
ncbi:DUF1616 domain-containing protein [Candidatus Gracilibacteria bacterium]|nr:DUF1616 domain-containing protein [Candidatus Gracilibacteria bacterium]